MAHPPERQHASLHTVLVLNDIYALRTLYVTVVRVSDVYRSFPLYRACIKDRQGGRTHIAAVGSENQDTMG